MNTNEAAILNDEGRKFAVRRLSAIKVLTQTVVSVTGKVRRMLFRTTERPCGNPTPARPPAETFKRQLVNKTAAQLFKMQRRAAVEVEVERRRRQKLLPAILAGALPDTLPALQFLEGRERAIDREMVRRGIVHYGD